MKSKEKLEICSYSIFEMAAERSISGRRPVKLILHEIHSDITQWQSNGISWNEQYTQENLDSVVGMSLCVEFLDDDRKLPYGHGLTEIRDNMPLFEDATMVGVCDKAYIDDVEIDGESKRALIAEGHLDEMRYPKFVEWLQAKLQNGDVKGSVEIVGKPENDKRIIYDGGWKEKGRVPQIYDYSGYAILGIRPADDTAIVLELNNKINHNNKEEEYMDEKTLNQFVSDIKDSVTTVITETNSKNADYEKQISELNEQIAAKDNEIAELNKKCKTLEDEAAEKETKISEQNTEITQIKETNAALEKEKAISELNTALADYTPEQQAFAQAEINAFKEDPTKVEINSVISKICTEMVRVSRENKKSHEQNSAPDIFGMVIEPAKDKPGEDVDIFN